MTINCKDLFFILDNTPSEQNIMLVGKHGIGKSEILTSYYETKGLHVEAFFLGQMSDAGDIIGLPYKDDNGRTNFMPPYWFPIDDRPVVLFLDELNRARPEILQVVQDLVLNRTIAGKKLPKGSVIISAINSGDEYTLTEIDPALLSRFNVYEFKPTVKEWLEWGRKSSLHDSVLSFIGTNEKFLDLSSDKKTDTIDKSYDRRSWVRVSNIMHKVCVSEYSNNSFAKLICGVVGQKAGAAFVNYIISGMVVRPSDVIEDFNSVKSRLEHFNVVNFTTLTEGVMVYLDALDGDNLSDKQSVNFLRYLALLKDNGSENIGYFVSLYMSGAYPNLSMKIAGIPQVDDMVAEYVSSMDING